MNDCCTFLKSWEPKPSAGMRTKVVGHLVFPQFPFKVRRFSRAQFSAKSKFWETVTKRLRDAVKKKKRDIEWHCHYRWVGGWRKNYFLLVLKEWQSSKGGGGTRYMPFFQILTLFNPQKDIVKLSKDEVAWLGKPSKIKCPPPLIVVLYVPEIPPKVNRFVTLSGGGVGV